MGDTGGWLATWGGNNSGTLRLDQETGAARVKRLKEEPGG